MKRLPKKLSKKNKDSKIKKELHVYILVVAYRPGEEKMMIKVVLREASMLDESKYVDIFPVIWGKKSIISV